MEQEFSEGRILMSEKSKKITIISLLSIVAILLGFLIVDDTEKEQRKTTIMIYMVGSNLESDYAIATSDLNGIEPESIDLEKINVLLYTGGTEKWHNFVSNDENAIYILKNNGFQKIESYEKLNMGSSKTLSSFLNYSYDNYKADTYNLILYDHGGAIDGAIYDDFTKDNLSLNDFKEALEDSRFSSEKKLDVVLFRTCLNGTIELANIFKDYANYLVASEEVSYGASGLSVLNFLNEVNNKTGAAYGEEFIKSYVQFIKKQNLSYVNTTYSIIDLSKIDEVNKLLEEFIASIDLDTNYRKILSERANLLQYASNVSSCFDTVDLYSLIDKLGNYSNSSNKQLLKAIDEAIVYNYSNDTNASHGLAIYFPFNGDESYQKYYLNIYKNLNCNEKYYNFIQKITNLRNSAKATSAFLNKDMDEKITENKNKEIKITLDEEMLKDYYATICNIFIKSEDYVSADMKSESDIYYPIYSTTNLTLTDNILTLKLDNDFIEIYDEAEDNGIYLSIIERAGIGIQPERVFGTYATLSKYSSQDYAKIYFEYKDNIPTIRLAILFDQSESNLVEQSMILNIEDYENISFSILAYRFDDLVDGDYYSEYNARLSTEISKLKLRKAGFYDDIDYYAQFHIYDIYGNIQSTKLIKINK